ncbi:DUF808 domain-containing protein [Ornithinimicrobium faecis]|uniref:DUF808 domain-containing protein n=1 Tax=Ornithinimicrobium faecis TaxID=2934158 RepID=UPI0021188EDA|nr:DUF808 domain-containing protein [Ornithinimicrobium sp. HY1745]
MAGGLAALLDDVAAIARIAAASVDDVSAAAARAGSKSLGVVIDDAAVTPQYVTGAKPNRELPIIKKIAIGSIRNKLLFILPAIMLLSQFVPWTLTPILMLGGSYLCFEGAEKVYEVVTGNSKAKTEAPVLEQGPEQENKMVRGAITTDFILSAEIMVIALNEVADEPFVSRLIILIIVALFITALVYGAVALIIKMDDIGLKLAENESEFSTKVGLGLVKAMPIVLSVLSSVGIVAMLWVGGHIILVGMNDLGWSPIYDWVHHVEGIVGGWVPAIESALAWVTNTFFSAILGLVWGAVIVTVVHFLPFGHKDTAKDEEPAH